MSRQILIGKLADDELNEYRLYQAQRSSLEANPDKYSKEEGESIYLRGFRFWGRLCEKYEIEGQREFRCDPNSGVLWYQEED